MKINKTHGNLFRSSVPTKWEHIQELQKSGVSTIINLQSSFIRECVYYGKEELLLTQYGIKVIYIPLSLFVVPSLQQLETIFSHIEKAESNILIHCKYGVDRTGISIAYWQIKKGVLSLEEAISEMVRHGFHKWYFWWIPILKKYLK